MKRFPVVHALAVVLAMFILGTTGSADALTYGALAEPPGWHPGTGTPGPLKTGTNDNFTIDTAGGVQVGLKAHQRFSGDALVLRTGNVYTVPTGFSPISGSPYAWWDFDYSINLGTGSFNDYVVDLKYDIDPGAGQIWKSVTTSGSTLIVNGYIVPGYLTGSIWQDYQNYGDVTWLGVYGFNPNQNADYNFILSVYNSTGGGLVASTDMLVKVGTGAAPVPIPGALVLFGSGLLGLVGIGRKRLQK